MLDFSAAFSIVFIKMYIWIYPDTMMEFIGLGLVAYIKPIMIVSWLNLIPPNYDPSFKKNMAIYVM